MSRLSDALELLDLGAWLEDYVETKYGGGAEVRIQECPMCHNDNWKLYINTEKKRWICYVCDWGRGLGDVVQLLSAVSGRGPSQIRIELMREVAPAPSGDITAKLEAAFNPEEETTWDIDAPEVEPPGTVSFTGVVSQRVLKYATGRGLTDAEIMNLGLRAAGSITTQKGDFESKHKGPFLVFPVMFAGRTVSWQGRRTYNQDPAYVSASNVKNWLWPLRPEFFERYQQTKRLVLVEGVFDALGLARLGVPALCTFGKSLSNTQLNMIQDLSPDEVVFAWDLDAAKEVLRAVDRVSYLFPRTLAASFDNEQGVKIDGGDILQKPEYGPWMLDCINSATDVKSVEFFQWRMLNG